MPYLFVIHNKVKLRKTWGMHDMNYDIYKWQKNEVGENTTCLH